MQILNHLPNEVGRPYQSFILFSDDPNSEFLAIATGVFYKNSMTKIRDAILTIRNKINVSGAHIFSCFDIISDCFKKIVSDKMLKKTIITSFSTN